jgi:tRNA(Ile2) C34 agmatinyltransferase TiaS
MSNLPYPYLTWAQTAAVNPHTPLCFDCGATLTPMAGRLHPYRCRDCRAPLAHVEPLAVATNAGPSSRAA